MDNRRLVVAGSVVEGRGLGYIPDVPKAEDYTDQHPELKKLFDRTAVRRVAAAGDSAPALVALVDLRASFSPVEDQGSLGSCTANAAVGLLEYFEKRASGRYVDASRLFVYKTERDLLGWTGDTGAYLRTAMEALVLFGAPPERYWAYDPRPPSTNTRYDVEPPAFCYAFGANYQAIQSSDWTGPGLHRRRRLRT